MGSDVRQKAGGDGWRVAGQQVDMSELLQHCSCLTSSVFVAGCASFDRKGSLN